MKSKDMPGMHMRAPAKKEEEKEKRLSRSARLEEPCLFGVPSHLTAGSSGTPSGIRTLDPLIKSQLLYQLS